MLNFVALLLTLLPRDFNLRNICDIQGYQVLVKCAELCALVVSIGPPYKYKRTPRLPVLSLAKYSSNRVYRGTGA